MHDACAVGLSESLADLRGDVDGVVEYQRPTGNPLLERLPLVVGHHQGRVRGAGWDPAHLRFVYGEQPGRFSGLRARTDQRLIPRAHYRETSLAASAAACSCSSARAPARMPTIA